MPLHHYLGIQFDLIDGGINFSGVQPFLGVLKCGVN
jgi:hypothetical protein